MVRAVVCLLALMAVAARAESPPAPHPTADFARLPFLEEPIISPDGKMIAAKVASEGKQYLATFPVGAGGPHVLALSSGDLNWWRWVDDDWLTIGVGDVVKRGDDRYYVRRALGASADMKTHRWLLGLEGGLSADRVIWTATDGSPRVLIAAQSSIYGGVAGVWPSVYEVDVSTGKARGVAKPYPGIGSWAADSAGTVRMGIGDAADNRSVRLVYRSGPDGGFREISRVNAVRGDDMILPDMLVPGKKTALTVAEDERGLYSLFELDLATMKTGRKLFSDDRFDVDRVVLDGTRTTALGAEVDEDRPVAHWFDPALAAVQASMDKAVAPRRATIVSLSRDASRMIVLVGSADQPGRYYLFDAADGQLHPLAWINEAFKRPLHPVRTVHYKARDGLDLSAVLTLPAGRDAKALPLIVMPHGGPFARDDESWDWWAQFMADRGYAVIQPNYRGSSGFGKPFARKGEGQWGLAMQDDLNDAVGWLAGEGIADPKRVCMVGGSYGGYAALRAAERDGKLYRCAVSYAGVSDLAALVAYDSSFLGGKEWIRRQAPNLHLVSPVDDPQGFSIPVLIMHGKEDKRVPVNQSRLMVTKLRAAGKRVTYIEQPLADHFFTREADRLQFLEALEAFLKANNPA